MVGAPVPVYSPRLLVELKLTPHVTLPPELGATVDADCTTFENSARVPGVTFQIWVRVLDTNVS